MGKPEGRVEDYLIRSAKKHDYLCYKFTSPSNAGVPDRILVGGGRTVFVECKAPGEKPRPLQIATFRKIEKHGVPVFVVDSPEAVDRLFDMIMSSPVPPCRF